MTTRWASVCKACPSSFPPRASVSLSLRGHFCSPDKHCSGQQIPHSPGPYFVLQTPLQQNLPWVLLTTPDPRGQCWYLEGGSEEEEEAVESFPSGTTGGWMGSGMRVPLLRAERALSPRLAWAMGMRSPRQQPWASPRCCSGAQHNKAPCKLRPSSPQGARSLSRRFDALPSQGARAGQLRAAVLRAQGDTER